MVDDAVTESARESTPSSSRRSVVEVVTRGEPRRRWSEEDRARILAEAMAPGAIASLDQPPIRPDTWRNREGLGVSLGIR